MKIEFGNGKSDVIVDWRTRKFLTFSSGDNTRIKEVLGTDMNWYYTSLSGLSGLANVVDRPYLEQLPTYRDVEGERTAPHGRPVIAVCRGGLDNLPAMLWIDVHGTTIEIGCCDAGCYLRADHQVHNEEEIRLGDVKTAFGNYNIAIKTNRDKIPYHWKRPLFNYARDLIRTLIQGETNELTLCEGALGALGIHTDQCGQFFLVDRGIPLAQLTNLERLSKDELLSGCGVDVVEYVDRRFTWIDDYDFVDRDNLWWSLGDPLDDGVILDKLDWKYIVSMGH